MYVVIALGAPTLSKQLGLKVDYVLWVSRTNRSGSEVHSSSQAQCSHLQLVEEFFFPPFVQMEPGSLQCPEPLDARGFEQH